MADGKRAIREGNHGRFKVSRAKKWKRGDGMNMAMFLYYAEEGHMFMWNDKPIAYSVLENMPFHVIRTALHKKTICIAIPV